MEFQRCFPVRSKKSKIRAICCGLSEVEITAVQSHQNGQLGDRLREVSTLWRRIK